MTGLIQATTGVNSMMTGPFLIIMISVIVSTVLWLFLTHGRKRRVRSIQTAAVICTFLIGVAAAASVVMTGNYSPSLNEALALNGVYLEEPLKMEEAIAGTEFYAEVNQYPNKCSITLAPGAQRDIFDLSRMETVTSGQFVVVCDMMA